MTVAANPMRSCRVVVVCSCVSVAFLPHCDHAAACYNRAVGAGRPAPGMALVRYAMGTFDLPDSYEFQQKTITWNSGIGPRNVVFRAVVINPGDGAVRVKIDDVGVACSTYP